MGTENGMDGAGRQQAQGRAQGQDTTATLLRLINRYQLSQALYVAAALGLADHLTDGPRTCEDLALASGADPGALYRLLRALAAAGIFSEQQEQRFALAPLGQSLRSDAAQPLGAWALQIGQPYYWQTWGHLLHSVRTGENAFRDLHGIDVWEYRRQHPEAEAVFVERVVAPPNEGAPAKLSDLNMLVAPGGRERTREEYGALLAAAGFRLTRTVPAGGDTQIVEGIPAS